MSDLSPCMHKLLGRPNCSRATTMFRCSDLSYLLNIFTTDCMSCYWDEVSQLHTLLVINSPLLAYTPRSSLAWPDPIWPCKTIRCPRKGWYLLLSTIYKFPPWILNAPCPNLFFLDFVSDYELQDTLYGLPKVMHRLLWTISLSSNCLHRSSPTHM